MNGILTRGLESSGVQPSSANTIEIDSQSIILSVAFLVDGKHIVSGDTGGKIRRWRVEDGMEAGTPMDAWNPVCNIAVSRDGKWIVSGTGRSGLVQVWNVDEGKKVTEFKGHHSYVRAVDVSPDSTKIASGSNDNTASVWSLSTGKRLLGPWEHDNYVIAVKFSPDGRFIATATWRSVSVYDDRDLVFNVPVDITLSHNHSLAWSSNSKQLFAVYSGKIICLDTPTGATLSQWSIHGDEYNRIALASDGAFIAASSGSSVSFWDATTHEQIGSVIQHTGRVECMAISANYDIAIGGGKRITLGSLNALRTKDERLGSSICYPASYLLTCSRSCEEKIANLKRVVRDLRHELATSQRAANQKEKSMNETINSLRAQGERSSSSIPSPASHVLTYFQSSGKKIVNIEKVVQDLRHELATSQRAASQKEKSMNETISSLVAQHERSSMSNSIPTSVIDIDVCQTTKLYSYDKKRTTSHTLFVFTSRSTNVKLCMPRAA